MKIFKILLLSLIDSTINLYKDSTDNKTVEWTVGRVGLPAYCF